MLPGIDTSHYSSISLQQMQTLVRDKGLYFNFLKASEGATIKDSAFTTLWEASRKSGLICGAYHFFRPLADVGAQVTNFVTQYRKVSRAGVLPPVVDLEWAMVGKVDQWTQLAASRRIPAIKMFLSGVEGELGLTPMIYTAPSFWQSMIAPQATAADNQFFAQCPLWVVDLRKTGKLPAPWTKALFIQTHFGEQATTNELYDHTDQDIFPGDTRALLNATAPGFTIMKGFPYSRLVVDLQNKLKALGLLQDAADGLFGANTEQALESFQSANGLFANGIVDAQTWNKLLV